MIFVTVGTTHPFDRLVRAVDAAIAGGQLDGEVFAQIGLGACKPRHCRYAELLDKCAFDELLTRASAIIAHAGMGVITTALERGKPLLVMPRRKRFGEVVNDHQVELAERYAAAGHVLLARDEHELPAQIRRLPSFVPHPRVPHAARVVQRVLDALSAWGGAAPGRV